MDESDRLTQFIEDRAKDTLLRFAVKRQERQSNGGINPRLSAVVGSLGTPRRVSGQGSHVCVCACACVLAKHHLSVCSNKANMHVLV